MININLNKAKNIAHEKRRALRSEEFAPYDEIIMKQIPGNNLVMVESERQKIREKYDQIQNLIEAVTSLEELKKILDL